MIMTYCAAHAHHVYCVLYTVYTMLYARLSRHAPACYLHREAEIVKLQADIAKAQEPPGTPPRRLTACHRWNCIGTPDPNPKHLVIWCV